MASLIWNELELADDQTQFFEKHCAKLDNALDYAIAAKRPDWCRMCLHYNKNLSFLDTPLKRDQQLHHTLQDLLND